MNDGILEVDVGLSDTHVISVGAIVLLFLNEMFMSLLPVFSTSQRTLKFWGFLRRQDRLYILKELFLWGVSELTLCPCGSPFIYLDFCSMSHQHCVQS